MSDETPSANPEQGPCPTHGTTWTASEPLPCPDCQDAALVHDGPYVVTVRAGQGAAFEQRLDTDPAVASWVYLACPPEADPAPTYADLQLQVVGLQAEVDSYKASILGPDWKQGWETPHPAYHEAETDGVSDGPARASMEDER